MNVRFEWKKRVFGLFYGLFGGFVFAVFAWGIDAWLLTRANGAFSLVRVIPGMIAVLIACGIVGWLTIRCDNHWWSLLFWSFLALFLSWLAVWLSFVATPYLLKLLDPTLAYWIIFPEFDHLSQFWILSLIFIGFPLFLGGLLEINLVEKVLISSYGSTRVMILLVILFLFGLAGSMSDRINNRLFREPVQVLDSAIQFAIDFEGREITPEIARRKSLRVVSELDDIYHKPRRLIVIAFDQTLSQVNILVNFNESRAKCIVIYEQPTHCTHLPELHKEVIGYN